MENIMKRNRCKSGLIERKVGSHFHFSVVSAANDSGNAQLEISRTEALMVSFRIKYKSLYPLKLLIYKYVINTS